MLLALTLRDAAGAVVATAAPGSAGLLLGSAAHADVRTAVAGASALHARLEPREGGAWWVATDMGTANGTLVVLPGAGGARALLKAESLELAAGAAVHVGAARFTVDLAPAAPAAPADDE